MISRLVIGLDGSHGSRTAATFAAELATRCGASVLALHAVGLLDRVPSEREPVPSNQHRVEILNELKGAWSEPLAGLSPEYRLVDGNPVSALLRTATDPGDIIIVGSRGAGGATDLGSTSSQTAKMAQVPVVIVPSIDDPVPPERAR